MTGVEPEIIEMPARHAVVRARDYTMASRNEIPALFEAFFSENAEVPNANADALLGVSFKMDGEGGFRYGVGRMVGSVPEAVPAAMEVVELVAGTYAVFRAFGPDSDIPALFDWVFTAWSPKSGFEITGDPVFESYPSDPRNGDGGVAFEIWSPLRR